MPAYAYRIVNVFTQGRTVLSGNPLCVFERARHWMAQMQALACVQFSETAFIPRFVIFTPQYEMPFAARRRRARLPGAGPGWYRLTLEMPAAWFRCRRGTLALQAARPPGEVAEPRFALAAMLGLAKEDTASAAVGHRRLEQLVVPTARRRCAACGRGPWRQFTSTEGRAWYVFAPAGGSFGDSS
jgi:predicted PhzF superfamily epimerase YddE/YHI9